MTMYMCHCGEVHDSSERGPCPVTITLLSDGPVIAVSHTAEMPRPGPPIVEPALPWKRRWFCPQCDRSNIRPMSSADWHDHLAAHTVEELREATSYAATYRSALEEILVAVEGLPGNGFVPEVVYAKVIHEARHALEWKSWVTPCDEDP